MGGARAFGSYHPGVTAAVLAAAVALGVLVRRPSFLVVGAAFAAASYLALRGRAGVRLVCGMAPLVVVVALVNPLFVARGETVLLTWLGGRPYTLEALAFGASTGAMLAGTLLWFGCWNAVMTTDKLSYLLGRVAPALALVLTMTLRLVPSYERAVRRFAVARASVGADVAAGGARERAAHAATLLSQLATWALESSVVTASSMRARGFGVARRTSFAPFRFAARDAALLAVASVCAVLAAAGGVAAAGDVAYYPAVSVPPATPLSLAGLAAYAALLAMPTFVTLKEAVSWRISLSRI